MPWTIHQYETERDALMRKVHLAEARAAVHLAAGHYDAANAAYDQAADLSDALDALESRRDAYEAHRAARALRHVGYALE